MVSPIAERVILYVNDNDGNNGIDSWKLTIITGLSIRKCHFPDWNPSRPEAAFELS